MPMYPRFCVVLTLATACGGSSDSSSPDAGTLPCTAKQDPFPLLVSGNITLAEGDWALHGHSIPGTSAFSWSTALRPGYVETARVGTCALYEPEPFGQCESCDGFCDSGGTCHPYGEPSDLGKLSISGDQSSIEFTWNGQYYDAPAAQQDYFAAGECLRLASESGPRLTAQGVAPLSAKPERVELSDTQDLVLSWQPATFGKIQLWLEYGIHGSPGTLLLCEQEDTGTMTVPASLMKKFPYFEEAQIGPNAPTGRMARFSRSTIAHAESVLEFFVANAVTFPLSHAAATR